MPAQKSVVANIPICSFVCYDMPFPSFTNIYLWFLHLMSEMGKDNLGKNDFLSLLVQSYMIDLNAVSLSERAMDSRSVRV